MGKGKAHGKVILYGEHFVVHGAPALACAIDRGVNVEIKESDENKIVTNHKVVGELSISGIENVLRSMSVDKKYEVHLEGDLPTYGGLGSSAAFCVALVRAIADEINLSITEVEVNKHAYEGEKAFHGMPSGIDNYIATHGGAALFSKEKGFKKVEVGKPLDMIVTFTGKISETKKMIDRVSKFKEEKAEIFTQLSEEAGELAISGSRAIEKGKLDDLGNFMNENQRILSEVGVSIELNEKITSLALKAGALGSKITGGGGGGCCISLARDKIAAQGIMMDLKKEGFESFYTRITG